MIQPDPRNDASRDIPEPHPVTRSADVLHFPITSRMQQRLARAQQAASLVQVINLLSECSEISRQAFNLRCRAERILRGLRCP